MSRPDNPRNFARIDFTPLEVEAIKEIRNFVQQLSQAPSTGDRKSLREYLLNMRSVGNALHNASKNGTFLAVDLTKDECAAICDCGEFLETLITDELKSGANYAKSENALHFQVVASSVRMKCRTAYQMVSHNLAS
jgi:hypothetical protein